MATGYVPYTTKLQCDTEGLPKEANLKAYKRSDDVFVWELLPDISLMGSEAKGVKA